MYKHILITTDGSDLSQKAVRHGLMLANALNAKVTAMTVVLPFEAAKLWDIAICRTPDSYAKRAQQIAGNSILQFTDAATALGITVNTTIVKAAHPWEAIIDAAQSMHCDLIIMASHGWEGISAIVLGSETQKVLAHSHIPVLVHR